MSHPLDEPPYIRKILDQPPPQRDCNRVKEWLNEPEPLKLLLAFTSLKLGYLATVQDDEDTWQDFCDRKLCRVILLFDRTRSPHFRYYLLPSLANYCGVVRRKLQRLVLFEQLIEDLLAATEGDSIELVPELSDPNDDPAIIYERQEFVRAINRCLETMLTGKERDAFRARHMDELSTRETAHLSSINENAVKQRLFRAIKKLVTCLRAEGWEQ